MCKIRSLLFVYFEENHYIFSKLNVRIRNMCAKLLPIPTTNISSIRSNLTLLTIMYFLIQSNSCSKLPIANFDFGFVMLLSLWICNIILFILCRFIISLPKKWFNCAKCWFFINSNSFPAIDPKHCLITRQMTKCFIFCLNLFNSYFIHTRPLSK